MVTLSKIGGQYNCKILEITGLSSEEKPTTNIENITISNGSKFKEIDTGKEYLFDYASKSWVEISISNAGKDGITPKLQKTETAIQVSYDNGSSYEDLVQLVDLKGEKGDSGKDGVKGDKGEQGINGTNGKDGITPKLQKTENAIQVSYDNGDSYEDLVLISELKGEKGDAGIQGKEGLPGESGKQGEKGASIQSIKLVKDENGEIISGTATLTDQSVVEITVTIE